MPQADLISPSPPRSASLPRVGSALSLLRDPVGFLASCRARLGDTFRVDVFGRQILFLFSPEGVRNLWETPERELSKGLADYELLRLKVPDELFAGRRTRPHDLFSRDDVEVYLGNVEEAVDAELEALGEMGEIELFSLARRVGHRVGLASWGGITGPAAAHLDRVIAAMNTLDSSDAFVQPVAALVARITGKRAAHRALGDLEDCYRAILALRRSDPSPTPDLFDRICDHWEGVTSPEKEIGIARDAVLVHMGSMSNLFAANAWTLVHLLQRPELLEAVRGGDAQLLRSCAHESIRLRQRSIVLRRALRPSSLSDGEVEYRVEPGAFVATMMPNTNVTAAEGLETFDPGNYPTPRFARAGDLEARELVSTFGHGAHTCPAMRFSIEAISIFVGRILERFDLDPLFEDPQPRRRQIGGIARADRPCVARFRRRFVRPGVPDG